MTTALDLFSYAEAEAAKRAGIAQAEANAPADWRDDVANAITDVARMRCTFTADDVWEWIETHGAFDLDVNPAALGPVMRSVAARGLIEKTGRLVPSRLARRHRDLVEWRRA